MRTRYQGFSKDGMLHTVCSGSRNGSPTNSTACLALPNCLHVRHRRHRRVLHACCIDVLDLHKEFSGPQATILSPCTAVRLPFSAKFPYTGSIAAYPDVLVPLTRGSNSWSLSKFV